MGEDALVVVNPLTIHLECNFNNLSEYPNYEIIAYKEDNSRVVLDCISNTNDLTLVREKFEEVKGMKDKFFIEYDLHMKQLLKLREENPGMPFKEILQIDNSYAMDEFARITLNEDELSQVNFLDERELE